LKLKFHYEKLLVSHRETNSFITGNKQFQALKQIVLGWGTTCLKAEDKSLGRLN